MPASSKEFLDIQATIECGFTLKRVRDMTRTYSQTFTSSQSSLLPNDSCIGQLLSIKDEIQVAFDNNPTVDVRGVFHDISKSFDKIQLSGLLFKLQAYGVESEFLALLKDYLDNCEQRVVLNGQTSDWRKINSGVSQGSVLGPFFFIFIKYLPDRITSRFKIFADDTSLFSKVYGIDISAKELNSDSEKICRWAFRWKTELNCDPNKQANEVDFSRNK